MKMSIADFQRDYAAEIEARYPVSEWRRNIAQLADVAGRCGVELTDSGESIVRSDRKGNGYSTFADGSWLDWNNAENQPWPDRGTWAAENPEAAADLEESLAK
jgi:hypothetical protein